MNVQYVDTPAALERLCQRLQGSAALALDTEFVRERTYYPQLGLIQIANEDTVACIDPLALDDLTPLCDLLFDESVVKVFHAGRQDMEAFYHLWQRLPSPVFDTQIAAALLGIGEQVGYGNLVKATLGVELAKSHSRTDWLQRPLSEEQVRYAADDVFYLMQIYPLQRAELQELGRMDWLQADFEALSSTDAYRPDPEGIWRRIKGATKLRGVQLAILRELAAWRERQAMAKDRPRRRIMGDDVLVDIARLQPKHKGALGSLRGIQRDFVDAHGDALLEQVRCACQLPRSDWPSLPKRKRLTLKEEALVDALLGLLKLIAAEHNISPALLASRKELEQLVQGEQDLPILQGWRLSHAGEQLQRFLQGDYGLQAKGFELTVA